MTKEAKVGAFTLSGILLLVFVVMHLSNFHIFGNNGYRLYAGFTQVVGVTKQTPVRLSGVPVGEVEDVKNDGSGVTVALRIHNDVRIPRDAYVTIASSGVMGEKYISILPGKGDSAAFSDGDYIIGHDEEGMDTMMAGLSKTVLQVQELLTSMNDIINNPQMKDALLGTVVNVKDAAGHINGLTAGLEQMVYQNQGDVRQIVQNLSTLTVGMNRTMGTVEHMMTNVDAVMGDPQTAENIRTTLENIASASARVERMAASVETVACDQKTMEDLKATIHNAREVSDRANKMLGKVSGIKAKPSVDVLYSGQESKWRTNFNLDVGEEKGAFLNLGLDDIGEENLFNMQGGKRTESFGVRAGIIASRPGFGVDAYLGKKWKFSADAYDFNDMQIRLRSQYELGGETYLMGELNHLNDSDRRAAFFGIRKTF